MSFHARKVIMTPGASRKRKEGEAAYTVKPTVSAQLRPASKSEEPVSSNRLLAGYLAYEFLTKGTLFGQRFDPARAEAVPLAVGSMEPKRGKARAEAGGMKEHRSYGEVARILKTDGAHIPGIVNPTQLASWIQR